MSLSIPNSQLFAEYPELRALSKEDLEDLLADPQYFQAIFHSLPRVKALIQARSELGMANESIASELIACIEDQLYALRTETQQAFNEAKSLEARWKELEKEQRELYQRFSSGFLQMRLRHATSAQDDLSESVASTFIKSSSGEIPDVDSFVKEFREVRKRYHKRIIWGLGSSKVDWGD
ncbi:hypothetical protein Clacol_009832 [Clathrus columnatus]|uniref:VPS37 C-terminal domain-containing protein n=1 Tax=Clathrus columnatus TaxID=1419009 RepID=A0AAV5ALR4_9AGAM|nr:hypothetical protein Clacol_009832 [Clathrus columnatus]